MPESFHTRPENRLLARLPAEALDHLRRQLVRVPLNTRDTLARPGETITHAYFPESGAVSIIAPLANGSIEVGLVGREGLVGVPAALSSAPSSILALVQVPGVALRISTDALCAALDECRVLRHVVVCYVEALFALVAQTAACNGRHSVEERLARWLLLSLDCVDDDQLPFTQELLSLMLGVRRAGITVAAGTLQKAGIIRYSRGHITILDRDRLEIVACECYRLVKDEFEHILGRNIFPPIM